MLCFTLLQVGTKPASLLLDTSILIVKKAMSSSFEQCLANLQEHFVAIQRIAVPLDTLPSYGRMISWLHKLGYVPFYYSKSQEEILVKSQGRIRSAHVLSDHEKLGKTQITLSTWLILALFTSYVVFNSSKSLAVLLNPKAHALVRVFIVYYTSLVWTALYNSFLAFLHPHALPSIMNQLMETRRRLPPRSGNKGNDKRGRMSSAWMYPVYLAFIAFNVTTTSLAAFLRPEDPRYVTSFLNEPQNCPLLLRSAHAAYFAFTYGMFISISYLMLATCAAVCDIAAQVCVKMR